MSKSPVIGLPYSSIFNDLMYGFDTQLEYFFGPQGSPSGKSTIKVVPLVNDSELSEAAKKSNTDKVGFPFFARKFNSIEERNDQMNAFLSRMDGFTRCDNVGNWFQFRLIPIKLNVTINFICLDQKDLFLFSQRWLDCSRLHYLDFDQNYNDNDLKIKVNCDPTITLPEFTGGDNDTGSMFNCETTANIDGFAGSITPITQIKQVNASQNNGLAFDRNKTTVPFSRSKYVIKDGQMYLNNQLVERN